MMRDALPYLLEHAGAEYTLKRFAEIVYIAVLIEVPPSRKGPVLFHGKVTDRLITYTKIRHWYACSIVNALVEHDGPRDDIKKHIDKISDEEDGGPGKMVPIDKTFDDA